MDLIDYYNKVYEIAKSYGVSDSEIKCFYQDIADSYWNNIEVEECVEIIF